MTFSKTKLPGTDSRPVLEAVVCAVAVSVAVVLSSDTSRLASRWFSSAENNNYDFKFKIIGLCIGLCT